jgi:hypothetical protein
MSIAAFAVAGAAIAAGEQDGMRKPPLKRVTIAKRDEAAVPEPIRALEERGEAMRPPSPVGLQAAVGADGALSVQWVRRSRLGWLWPAESELPLGESSERYRVTVQGSGGTLTFEAVEPQIVIPPEALAGTTGSATISVVQVGDFAESRPAAVDIAI